jgi:hypothetical protein
MTQAEYDADIMLRMLWARGMLNPETQSSCLDRLGMPPGGFHDADEDYRLEAQDELRQACRAMGMLGMGGR